MVIKCAVSVGIGGPKSWGTCIIKPSMVHMSHKLIGDFAFI